MKSDLALKASRSFHKIGFSLQKHSPEILIVTGVIGVVTSAVLACKATMKLKDVLEDGEKEIDKIDDKVNSAQYKGEYYTEEEAEKDIKTARLHTGLEITKLYSPAVTIGVASIVCIFASNNIMRKRTAALAAAYTTLDQSFKQYRKRVVEELGSDIDQKMLYGARTEKVTEEIVDEEGNTKTVEKDVTVVDSDLGSPYARFFDSSCGEWTKNPDYNLQLLISRQKWLNDKLRARGYLFLNEVYDELGIPQTIAGQSVGWIYDEKNPVGDNYVDFGIFDASKEKNRDFVNGYENVILLDFNVDGNILEFGNERGKLGKI